MKKINTLIAGTFAVVAALSSCQRGHDDTGTEYAPNMYNSVGYEPYSQIEKNPINADGKNMREPVRGTVSRRNYKTKFDSASVDLMIYHIGKDDIATAETVLKNPIPNTEKTLADGKALYGDTANTAMAKQVQEMAQLLICTKGCLTTKRTLIST